MKRAVAIAGCVLALLAVWVFARPFSPSPPLPFSPSITYANTYDSPQQFMEGIYAADRDVDPPPRGYRIRALIVPHHLTATAAIAAGIRTLEHQSFSKILLLSPDHFARCASLLCTVNADYETIFGKVPAAPETVKALLASPLVSENAELFRHEHGIHAVIPYIAHYFPGIPVTPLAFSQERPWKTERAALLEVMGRAVDDETLLIVSSDFSHYLPLASAEEMDELTAQRLFSKDLGAVVDLENPSQSDCPGCLWLLASLADERGYYNPSVIMHTNSATILDDADVPETTSHFSIAWYGNAALAPKDLAVAGDVTVTRGDAAPLSETVSGFWRDDGPRFVNLEGPLARRCVSQKDPYAFCNPEERWLAVRDLATHWGVRNNHMLDRGAGSVKLTEKIILEHGETPVGADGAETDGLRLYAATAVMNPVAAAKNVGLPDAIAAVLKDLEANRDEKLAVVLVHAGAEYLALSGEAEDALYEKFIDAGADVVLVSHSHVVGDVRIYEGKPIFRGLGNFVFDQTAHAATSTAKMVRLRKDGDLVLFETLIAK